MGFFLVFYLPLVVDMWWCVVKDPLYELNTLCMDRSSPSERLSMTSFIIQPSEGEADREGWFK